MYMPRVTWVVLITILALGLVVVSAAMGQNTSCATCATATATAPCPVHATTAPCPAPAAAAPCPPPCPTPVAAEPCPPPCPTPAAAPCPVAVPCPPGMSAYDFCKETAITGVLVSCPAQAATTDVDFSMMVRTRDGVTHRVWLAPQVFLTSINFAPTVGSLISAIGMPIGTCGDFVARQIVYGCDTFTLRDVRGAPLWAVATDPGLVRYATLWDPHRIETACGRIDKIACFSPASSCGAGSGVAIRLSWQPPDNVPTWQLPSYEFQPRYTWVHLGPSAYVTQQLGDLREGQVVAVIGSHARWCTEDCDDDVLLAACLQRGTRTYAFRDATGSPAWAGGWRAWSETTMLASTAPFGTYQTVTGTIEDIRVAGPVEGFGNWNILTLRTTNNCLIAAAVSDQAGICFKNGDCVSVCGYVGAPMGQQVLIANQIGHNGQMYVLNSANGTCTWVAGGAPMATTTVAATYY